MPALENVTEQLAEKLISLSLSLSSAESCTGGGLGHELTSIAGSSAWYLGGIIAYSNSVKEQVLGVPFDVLERHGAVSEETASLMASGAAKVIGSDLAISTTGIAGPDGGSEQKPVGMVCFGWQIKNKVLTDTAIFAGDRESVRSQSIDFALKRLLKELRQ